MLSFVVYQSLYGPQSQNNFLLDPINKKFVDFCTYLKHAYHSIFNLNTMPSNFFFFCHIACPTGLCMYELLQLKAYPYHLLLTFSLFFITICKQYKGWDYTSLIFFIAEPIENTISLKGIVSYS